MNDINIQYYKTKIGELLLGSFENKLCLMDYRYRRMRNSVDNRIQKSTNAHYVEKNNDVLETAKQQIDEYLNKGRTTFDLPLLMLGTEFQKSVWNGLLAVPYGETSSYLQLAQSIDNEKAVRAVASANGANAMSIIIPCHRIIGSDGSLVGYAGGLPAKKHLLDLEKNNTPLSDDNASLNTACAQQGIDFI